MSKFADTIDPEQYKAAMYLIEDKGWTREDIDRLNVEAGQKPWNWENLEKATLQLAEEKKQGEAEKSGPFTKPEDPYVPFVSGAFESVADTTGEVLDLIPGVDLADYRAKIEDMYTPGEPGENVPIDFRAGQAVGYGLQAALFKKSPLGAKSAQALKHLPSVRLFNYLKSSAESLFGKAGPYVGMGKGPQTGAGAYGAGKWVGRSHHMGSKYAGAYTKNLFGGK